MTISSRWQKILNDIWGNKQRSLLVILSIAIGVGVVGMINNARYLIERDLYTAYQAGNPASVLLYTSPFQEDLAQAVEGTREVESAQPRRGVNAIFSLPNGEGDELSLAAFPDYNDIKVNQLVLVEGNASPGLREVLIEKNSAEGFGLEVGDQILVEMSDESKYELIVSGIVHDIYEIPYSIRGEVGGYVSVSTLQWMGVGAYYTRLDVIVVDNNNDREYALSVAGDIRDRVIEPSGVSVGSIQIPGVNSDPGEHWAQNQITGFVLILQVMSVMAIFLSGGLVVNTVSAILIQQVKQIGIMRSIGAERPQIITMYVFNVFVFCFIGWLLAIPLGLAGSWGLAKFAANFLNFSITKVSLSPGILILQTVIAFIVPVGVALYPILAGMAISVYDAIYQNGLINEEQKGWLEKLIARLNFLSPAMVVSILNTFRNIPRLAFTLVTLTLAGATFVAAFSTRASLNAQVTDLGRYVNYDASISVSNGASKFTSEREALRTPNVVAAEGWAKVGGVEILPNGVEGEELTVVGVPFDSIMLDPKIEDGRWLEETDSWQVVVNEDLVTQNPAIQVGSSMVVKVGETNRTFQVIGVTSKHLSGGRVYIHYPMFSKLTGRNDQVNEIRVRTDLDKVADKLVQDQVGADLEDRFSNAGLSTSTSQTNYQAFGFFSDPFGIILIVLLIMAGLLALVGGLSLAGTMGINVMERTREIGVLRSVGASNGAIRQVVVVEGLMIALISWILVVVLSGPSGAALASAVVYAVLKTGLTFRFSMLGLFIWLALVVVIGVASSLAPAHNAVRLTVREVLDYE